MNEFQQLLDFANQLSDDDPKTLDQRHIKASEELGELASALLSYGGTAGALHRYRTQAQVLEEVADTMLALYSIARAITDPVELQDILYRKCLKWQSIQASEGGLKDRRRIPFEIHVSIGVVPTASQNPFEHPMENFPLSYVLSSFREACAELGVKATILTLYNSDETTSEDWMTSSVHIGTNESADVELRRIAAGIETWCDQFQLNGPGTKLLTVVRQKIETVPWHPAAPSANGPITENPKDCYFEKHWEILVEEDRIDDLHEFILDNYCMMSRNKFKPMPEGKVLMSMTLRSYVEREEFMATCEAAERDLVEANYEVVDSVAEYAIYDSAAELDARWVERSAQRLTAAQ